MRYALCATAQTRFGRLAAIVAGLLLTCWLAPMALAWGGESPRWTHTVETPRPPRRGKPRKPATGHLWIPDGIRPGALRGLIVAQKTLLEAKLVRAEAIRAAAAESGLGILYFAPAFDALFLHAPDGKKPGDAGERLQAALTALAETSGYGELPRLPFLTIGHSTGGIFARNVAYWRPERVLGVIHIKSGNLHQHMVGENRSLAGVPFLAINGEWEEYGPEGGDRPKGIRSRYGRQTQWIMIRQALLKRRAADPEDLFALVVHPGGNHTNWSGDLTALCALFIRKAAHARLPARAKAPTGEGTRAAEDAPRDEQAKAEAAGTEETEGPAEAAETIRCRPLRAAEGWLTDADLKQPRHPAAPYDTYAGDKADAFWHFDQEMAEAVNRIHGVEWKRGDPDRHPAPAEAETKTTPADPE